MFVVRYRKDNALLVYGRPGAYDGLTDDQLRALTAEYIAIRHGTRMMGGGRLKPVDTAITLRMLNGESLITDGPFAYKRGFRRLLRPRS